MAMAAPLRAGPPPPPPSRNLTHLFVRHREERRSKQGKDVAQRDIPLEVRLRNCDPHSKEQLEEHLLSAGKHVPEADIEMAALPPRWLEAAAEARGSLKELREELPLLRTAQRKRLMRVFSDGASDREVDALAQKTQATVRRCEQHIQQVKARGPGVSGTAKERKTWENVQQSLATQLQGLVGQLRQAQKTYVREIGVMQGGAFWANGESDLHAGDAGAGFSTAQLAELEDLESSAAQRSTEIGEIAQSITELHTIFKELAVLVIDQGSILDRIDYNIEAVVEQTAQGRRQLAVAEATQKKGRALKCILLLALIDVILLVVLIVRSRH